MQGVFPYFQKIDFLDEISIDNIGECCLAVNNDSGIFWYLWITTSLGLTKVFQYGPEMDGLPLSNMSCNYQQFQYSEKKLNYIIRKFLNNTECTQIEQINPEDIIDRLIDLKEFMNE